MPRSVVNASSTKAARRFGRFGDFVVTALIFATILALIRALEPSSDALAGRADVGDGDTITIGEERIRLKGIDAPELKQTCRAGAGTIDCGRLARRRLEALAGDGTVTCEASGRDRYRRVLAVCRAGERDLGAEMVREGWAIAYGGYAAEEREARAAARGLWRWEFMPPEDWRVEHGEADGGFDPLGWFLSWF